MISVITYVLVPFAQKRSSPLDNLEYIIGRHSLHQRYHDLWKLCENSWYGGEEYKRGQYLRAYAADTNTPSETINTYVRESDGSFVSKHRAKLEKTQSQNSTDTGEDDIHLNSFYGEKLANTPLYNYVKLIVAEYNSILFRNPPQRELPDSPEVAAFLQDVDGEGNSLTEFMALVDMYSTIYGVCHVGCYKPAGSDIPRFRIHKPLDVTNWEYRYNSAGNLELFSVVVQLDSSKEQEVYRHITPEVVETFFVGEEDSDDYEPPAIEGLIHVEDNTYKLIEQNELGYVPITTVYQSTKIYNNIGTTVIHDVAQIQRSIYGDLAEIYSSITYGAHPTLIVDSETEQLNDGQVGAEPGSIVRVQNSLTGEASYVYEFVAPQLDAISEIKDLIDNKITKLAQIAMLRTEELIKSSRSGEQIEQYDDKLAGLIRRKATNLENAEFRLWQTWGNWLNIDTSDAVITYSRQYNKRALEHEIAEIKDLMSLYLSYKEQFPDTNQDFDQDLRDKLQSRMLELVNSSSTRNGL